MDLHDPDTKQPSGTITIRLELEANDRFTTSAAPECIATLRSQTQATSSDESERSPESSLTQSTEALQNIKKRHDPTVTTVAQGVLEWKRKQKAGRIGQSIQEWLDRFYMSRIGIRFLIGQRESMSNDE